MRSIRIILKSHCQSQNSDLSNNHMSFSTLYHQQIVNPHHYLAFCHFYGSVIIQQYTLICQFVAEHESSTSSLRTCPSYLKLLSLYTAGGSDFCTIGVNIEPWTCVQWGHWPWVVNLHRSWMQCGQISGGQTVFKSMRHSACWETKLWQKNCTFQ